MWGKKEKQLTEIRCSLSLILRALRGSGLSQMEADKRGD